MLKLENIKLASSQKYVQNILSYIKDNNPKNFLDIGCGIGNKLGRYIQENTETEVFVNDEKELEAIGKCKFITFEEIKKKQKKFDIIHASCLLHEVCAIDEFEQREIKGGPHTIESAMLAELFHDILEENGTLIIEDFVACSYDEFIDNHYFIKTLDKSKYKEIFNKLEVSLIQIPNENNAKEDLENYKEYIDLMQRIFFKNEALKQGEFKSLDEFGKILVYLKRYRDHHTRHNKEVYENLFQKAGFTIKQSHQDSPLTMQWFLQRS